MECIKGKGVARGIVMGKLLFSQRDRTNISKHKVENPKEEYERYHRAKEKAKSQLEVLYEKALKEVGESAAQIFVIHQTLLEDVEYESHVKQMILEQGYNAEYAVNATSELFQDMFRNLEDEYIKERFSDVEDISKRLLDILFETKTELSGEREPVIICGDDFAPSETIQMDKNKILAICTRQGSASSHTAILAKTMNLPAVVACGEALEKSYDGKVAIVDGYDGIIYIDPDEETVKQLRMKRDDALKRKIYLQDLKGKESVTKNGQKVWVCANVGGLNDISRVKENDGEGIGLFRSEVLYLESSDYPKEEEQFLCYKKILQEMGEKKVIIRTMDIGADKKIDYFHLEKEENPALGLRAIRLCLERPEIFKTQLRALYRASVYGKLGIMFPMITSVEEVQEIKEQIDRVQQELSEEHIQFDKGVELGIMIETPAAAMISDLLAEEVDFFSIGSNDLTQYALAVDRQNQKLERYCNPHHLGVLRMIEMVVKNAHSRGKWAGICGELAGDLTLTEYFVRLQIDELSVAPSMILPLREKIRSL